jgi:hypothetical protein
VSDWIYDALAAFETFMNEASLADIAVIFGISALGGFLIVAVHECGHALAAVLTGNRVRELRVGDSDDLTVTVGAFRLRLGRLPSDSGVVGYMIHDCRSVTPVSMIAIALAGPVANLLAAAASAALAVRAEGIVSVMLFLWALSSLAGGLGNLRPHGDPGRPSEWNDGRLAQVAWMARRLPPPLPHSDPNRRAPRPCAGWRRRS